jgi:hypothetical protein
MTKEYDVGYGKPPVKHQFKKGKSGNPRGRWKRPKPPPLDPEEILIAELKSLVTIIENGKKKQVTKLEAIQKSYVNDAIKGKETARNKMWDFIQKQPKYAFEKDKVAWVVTEKEVEAFEKVLEDTRKAFPELCEPNSNQEQGNGSSSWRVDNQEKGNDSSSGGADNQKEGSGSSSGES